LSTSQTGALEELGTSGITLFELLLPDTVLAGKNSIVYKENTARVKMIITDSNTQSDFLFAVLFMILNVFFVIYELTGSN
jgi:hypothetical protein